MCDMPGLPTLCSVVITGPECAALALLAAMLCLFMWLLAML